MFADLSAADQVLNRCHDLLRTILQRHAAAWQEDGRLSVRQIDANQLAAFGIAGLVADHAAARSLLDYAAAGGDLSAGLACAMVAEFAGRLEGEIRPCPEMYGLSAAESSATGREDIRSFCSSARHPDQWNRLGDLLLEQGLQDERQLSEDLTLVRTEFRRIVAEKVTPRAEAVHRGRGLIPEDLVRDLAELGCFGLSIPAAYDGLMVDGEPNHLRMCLVTEELSRGSLGMAGSLTTRPEILAKALLKGGTPEQKQHWLPAMATGEKLCAVAVTEPDYGSDVAGVRVSAEAVDGGFRLNGQKAWCTFAGYSDVLMVLARTDPDLSRGHRGLSIFLVEKPRYKEKSFRLEQPGGGCLSGQAVDTIGYRGMHSFDVFFEDFVVPGANLLGGDGGLGKGFYYQMEGFSGGRLQTAARATGVMQAALDKAMDYGRERQVFGRPVAGWPLSKWKLARMAMLTSAARQFTYGTARQLEEDQGQVEASMVKLWSGRAAEWVAREAMQIHGGMGYAEEYDVSRYYVDARVLSIFEGAEETLALRVIARQMLERAMERN